MRMMSPTDWKLHRIRALACTAVLLTTLAACSSSEQIVLAPATAVPATEIPPTSAPPTAVPPTAEPTAPLATPEPTPPSHPWYECETFDHALIGFNYRVVNIADDDPDGGLIAHVSPGIGTAVTEVLPDGLDELQISGCQQNPSSGNVWWQVETNGWVNASYLQTHVPFGSEDWIPAMTNPLDSASLPNVFGVEGEDLPALAEAVQAILGSDEPIPQVELNNFMGVDARGGIARLDISGLGDDSVHGYRMEVTIELIKDDTATDILGYRIVSAVGRAICSRGVSDGGDLCI